jgi:hypothetical protein
MRTNILEPGHEVIGFEFKPEVYNNGKLNFACPMNSCIGEIGEVIRYDEKDDIYLIQFPRGLDAWYYPAELVHKHAVGYVDKPNKITIEEATLLDLARQLIEAKYKITIIDIEMEDNSGKRFNIKTEDSPDKSILIQL